MWIKPFRCEWLDCHTYACDIHHIQCSYRWDKSKHEKPNELIALCQIHHVWIHKHNNFENRNNLLDFTKKYDIPQQQEDNNWLN